jgi:hypothetical protein
MKTILTLIAAMTLATTSGFAESACKKCCKDKCAECCKDKGKTCGTDCCKKGELAPQK